MHTTSTTKGANDSGSASRVNQGALSHVSSSLARVERLHVHLSPQDRVARGKAARRDAPRSSHGQWEPGTNRLDPIALLEEQAKTRVPELVPIRHGRMLVSPFTFYRGAALIMAADLAATPQSRLTVQLCGDAHLSNFGVFGSPERQMMFDINDFDETLPGPWEWDVKRLAASFEIAGREGGFAPSDRRAIVLAGVQEYREWMRHTAGMCTLDTWYAHMKIRHMLDWIRTEVQEERLGQEKRGGRPHQTSGRRGREIAHGRSPS